MRVQVKAQHKMARISPQKARLVADQIRNKPVAEAMQLLSFSNKKAATLLLQVLRSAIANAVHNEGVDGRRLAVVSVMIDEAKTFKRFRARARGRANQILKRTSHIMIAVGY